MSKDKLKLEYMGVNDIKPFDGNPRKHPEDALKKLVDSINHFGWTNPILLDEDNIIVAGHARLKAAKKAGMEEVPVIKLPLSGKEAALYNIADNKTQELTEWDWPKLGDLFHELDTGEFDLEITGFSETEISGLMHGLDEAGIQEDEVPEPLEEPITQPGDLWILGEHRLLCGDCTQEKNIKKLMRGQTADMIFTDPPYGIGKEIINDNLKKDDWFNFYQSFTGQMLSVLKVNGYFYVWGYFETLSDYWQEVIKKRGDCNFRNFIVWKKTFIQGLKSLEFRQFPENYVAAILIIYGQPFQNGPWSTSPNAEHYWDGFDSIRLYLDGERKKMGWSVEEVKKIVGHSDLFRDHWFGKSQWTMPTREVYEALRDASRKDAFRKEYDDIRKEYDDIRKEYDDIRKEYDDIRKEYDDIRKEYDGLRGHFDNSHGWTDIWQFDKLTTTSEHPTVKPLEVCERGILTTSKKGELVLDIFLGSGSTLIAAEQLGRKCYAMEIEPKYCDVAVKRWENLTGKKAERKSK